MDAGDHAGSEDLHDSLGFEGLAVVEDESSGEADGVGLVGGASGGFGGGGDDGESLRRVEAHAGGDPAVADLSDDLHRAGAVGGDVDGDEVVEVEELGVLAVDEADPALLAGDVVGVEHVLAVEQSAHLLGVLAVAGDRVGGQAHGVASGVAGADAEDDASGRQLVERGDGGGGDRGDAVGGDGDQGAELDRRGVVRGEGHGRVDVGVDELGVVEPGVGEAGGLGALDFLPGVDPAGDSDSVVHG